MEPLGGAGGDLVLGGLQRLLQVVGQLAHAVVDLCADDLPARDAEVPLQHPAPSRLEGELLLDLLNLVQRPLQILGPP